MGPATFAVEVAWAGWRQRAGKQRTECLVGGDLGEWRGIADVENAGPAGGCEMKNRAGGIVAVDLVEETPAVFFDDRFS